MSSISNVSAAYPANRPSSSAWAMAFSSTTEPRPAFTTYTPRFILRMVWALIRCSVEEVSGASRTMMSLCESSSSKLDRLSPRMARSEEHTSELQSRQYLVCRLLLEKKKDTVGACLAGQSDWIEIGCTAQSDRRQDIGVQIANFQDRAVLVSKEPQALIHAVLTEPVN